MPKRTILKALIHQYFDLMDRVKELTAETSEHWQDLVAEVEAERKTQQEQAQQAVAQTGSDTPPSASPSPPSTEPQAGEPATPQEGSPGQFGAEPPDQS